MDDQIESYEEDEVIIRAINESIQRLIDSQAVNQKAITRLQESLQALKDYHSREIIEGVLVNVSEKPF